MNVILQYYVMLFIIVLHMIGIARYKAHSNTHKRPAEITAKL